MALLAPDGEQLHRIHLEKVVGIGATARFECLKGELLSLKEPSVE